MEYPEQLKRKEQAVKKLLAGKGTVHPITGAEQPLYYRNKVTASFGFRNGKLIAGLDACITAFKILYVSTVFVDEEYRRKGLGAKLVREMEKRAAALGVNTIRLDTFNWQGKEFYEALGYRSAGHYENPEDGYSEYFFVKRIH